ncbi:hypothetical protein HBI38_125480 [Parastagonospora nodorum]|nr:hypothetical protein HBH61_129310 [Parastagonospora nodorum]KAH4937127.1 hypothetical protein HBH74_076900 [Parastagonospora nodorum]KAH4948363.1 hypothetical protein HBH73_122970 [Parastagonospora nodorum]KAH5122302.1 hypothetical protein HBI73_105700 [Parastagonospora nodorum]KAH5184603.1 hypothetical protein HBH76_135300 [Parastagonospora nodorum]
MSRTYFFAPFKPFTLALPASTPASTPASPLSPLDPIPYIPTYERVNKGTKFDVRATYPQNHMLSRPVEETFVPPNALGQRHPWYPQTPGEDKLEPPVFTPEPAVPMCACCTPEECKALLGQCVERVRGLVEVQVCMWVAGYWIFRGGVWIWGVICQVVEI